jgi:hypothetical protein
MARRSASLKPHLNQIRTWVAEGVTDIWIAHQLESTPASIAAFRRRHGLTRPTSAAIDPVVQAAGLATAAPLADEPGAGVDTAIDEGVALFEAGAQGEHKLRRGFEPALTHSAHRLAHPGLHEAVARYVADERRAIADALARWREDQ